MALQSQMGIQEAEGRGSKWPRELEKAEEGMGTALTRVR